MRVSETRTPPARTFHQRARGWIWLALVLAVVLLGWAALDAHRQSRITTAGGERVDHTLRVLNTALRFETTVLAMESEHRGHLVQGDAIFAQARDQHARAADDLLGALRALVVDNPTQSARLRQIQTLLDLRHDAMRESSALVDGAGIDAGRENFRSQGIGSIQPLQALLAELRRAEETLLEARSRDAVEAAARLRWSLLYGPAVGLVLVLLGVLALLRQLGRTDALSRELVAANAMQHAMLDNAGLMIIGCAPDGRITLFNRAASQALGYTADEMIGKATPAVFHDAEEIATRAAVLTGELGQPVLPGFEVFTTNPLRGMHEAATWTYVRRGGGRFPVQLVVSALRDDDDVLLGFLGIGQDISERLTAERDIRALNATLVTRGAQLEESLRDLESFSYSVSHDLRAPLRHIDGYARMLQEDAGDTLDAECSRYLREIGASSRRMGRLIDDLLVLSRLGRTALRREPVDMDALVRDACRELGTPGSVLPAIALSPLPPCVGDSALLRQVWVNLLSNAVKYSAPRGADARIRVRGEQVAGGVRYSVIDNGVGFDMRFADKLFGVFQRLHTQDEFEGTGVGLAIVRRVVTRHDGQVSAQSNLGAGAEFSFELPMEDVT